MSGARITVDDASVLASLQRLIAASGNVRDALENIGEELQLSTKARIVAGHEPDGRPFEPLNPLYALNEKKGPGILRSSGDLLESIVYQLGGDGESVEIGTDMIYGAIHQFGGTINPKNGVALVFSLGGRTVSLDSVTIPQREYLGISDADRTVIMTIFTDFLAQAAGEGAVD